MSGMSDVSPVAWASVEDGEVAALAMTYKEAADCVHPLYSHATVTTLMAERDALRESAGLSGGWIVCKQSLLDAVNKSACDWKQRAESAEAERDALAKDAERLDYIERTFSGMTNRERYLPVQMIWGKGAMGRTLREACDKYMKRDNAMTKGERG